MVELSVGQEGTIHGTGSALFESNVGSLYSHWSVVDFEGAAGYLLPVNIDIDLIWADLPITMIAAPIRASYELSLTAMNPVGRPLPTFRYPSGDAWSADNLIFVLIDYCDREIEASLTLWIFKRDFCKDLSSNHLCEALFIYPLLTRWHVVARISVKESDRCDVRVKRWDCLAFRSWRCWLRCYGGL